MPSLPTINLNKGQVIIIQSNSPNGLNSDGTILFGTVQQVYSTSDRLNANDYILYKPSEAKRLIYGSTIYFLIDENYVWGTETYISPP